jgi:hypothetical protein
MKPSKRKKKLRWLDRDAVNPKRAKVIRDLSEDQAKRIRRNG